MRNVYDARLFHAPVLCMSRCRMPGPSRHLYFVTSLHLTSLPEHTVDESTVLTQTVSVSW